MHGATLLLAVLAVTTMVGSQQQAAAPAANPFVGHWTADLSKSKLDPKYPFQGAALEIAVAGDMVTMTSRLIHASGREQQATETFRTDGTETPGTLTPGVSHVARWVGSHVLATIAKKDGNVIALMTYEVSSDGKTLTTRSSGLAEQVILMDRR